MSIIKVHQQNNFSIIPNTPLNDPDLSFKAKGLWAYLFSKPGDWEVYIAQLVKASTDGKRAIYSALAELKQAGYVEHRAIREGSKIVRWEYVVYGESVRGNVTSCLLPQNVHVANVQVGNAPLLNTDSKQKLNNSNNRQNRPLKNMGKSECEASAVVAVFCLTSLMNLVPVDYQKPAIEKLLDKALKNGHTEAYVKEAILYTNDYSTGNTWSKYRSYLSKTLDGGWGEGYEPDPQGGKGVLRSKKIQNDFLISRRTMPSDLLKLDAMKGCQASKQVLAERGITV